MKIKNLLIVLSSISLFACNSGTSSSTSTNPNNSSGGGSSGGGSDTSLNWQLIGSNTDSITTDNMIYDSATEQLYKTSYGSSTICHLNINANTNTDWNCDIQFPSDLTTQYGNVKSVVGGTDGKLFAITSNNDIYYVFTYDTKTNSWNSKGLVLANDFERLVGSLKLNSATYHNNHLYFLGFEDTDLVAVDLSNGNISTAKNFFNPASSIITFRLVIDQDNFVYYRAGNTEGIVYKKALNSSSNATQISQANLLAIGTPTIVNNHLYYCGGLKVFSISTSGNNQTHWTQVTPTSTFSDPYLGKLISSTGCTVITSGNGYLYAYGNHFFKDNSSAGGFTARTQVVKAKIN